MTAQILTASRLREGDVVYFTAAGHWSEWLSDATVACIGPVTAATAGEVGLHVDIVAQEHTIDGLVTALENELSREAIRR